MGIDAIVLVMVVVLAAAALLTSILRHAIIYVGVFSLLISFLYLFYGAPDVAIAESVIGSGLIMLLYLTAIKRYRTYIIYVVDETVTRIEDATIQALSGSAHGSLLEEMRRFCISRELEPQFVFTSLPFESVRAEDRYDLIVRRQADEMIIVGRDDNFLVDELEMLLIMHAPDTAHRFVRAGDPV